MKVKSVWTAVISVTLPVVMLCLTIRAAEAPRVLANAEGRLEYDNPVQAVGQSFEFGVSGFWLSVSADAAGTLDLEPSLAALQGRTGVRVFVELGKTGPLTDEVFCRKVLETVRSGLPGGDCVFTSANELRLTVLKKADPKARTVLTVKRALDAAAVERAKALGAAGVAALLKGTDGKTVAAARAAGLSVHFLKVENGGDYRKARALGADTVTSDAPVLLVDVQKLYDAKAADPSFNGATFPNARYENDSYNWFKRHRKIMSVKEKVNPEVVFIGDSITHFWCGRDDVVAGDEEKTLPRWKKSFGGLRTLNIGFGWDRTGNVLKRIELGELDGIHPKTVVVMIGGNNFSAFTPNYPGDTAEQVVAGYVAVVDAVHAKLPDATIVAMAIFPFGKRPTDFHRPKIAVANPMLEKRLSGRPYVKFLDLTSKLLDKDGVYPDAICPGAVHPNDAGYEIWAAALMPYLKAD